MFRIREMTSADAEAVARLHAESWRSAYRGILRDAYLDGPVDDEWLDTWTKRLAGPGPNEIGLVADKEPGIVGFVFAVADHDPELGAFLDNLHVSPPHRGQGVGSRLLLELSRFLLANHDDNGLYLWVFENNCSARGYYEKSGAVAVRRAEAEAPGGGIVTEWLYRWTSVAHLY